MDNLNIVLPIKIKILKIDSGPMVTMISHNRREQVDLASSLFDPYYNHFGQMLFDIRPHYYRSVSIISEDMVMDFDSSMYEMTLNVFSDEKAGAYLDRFFEKCQFLSCDQPMIKEGTSEFLTEQEYDKLVKDELTGVRAYNSHFAAYKKWDNLDDQEIDELYDAYISLFEMMRSDLMSTSDYYNLQNEIIVQVRNEMTDIIPQNIDPVAEGLRTIGFKDSSAEEPQLEFFQKFERIFVNRFRKKVDDLYAEIINQNKLVFNMSKEEIWYICPTVLSAMYTMALVSKLNNRQYKKCIAPNCNTYFLVDNSHPQKRCEKHIKPLQNRRQKQKISGLRRDEKKGQKKKGLQFAAIDKAKTRYQNDKDIDSYIRFWETLWETDGGPLSRDSEKVFALADLYIEKGDIRKALGFVCAREKEKDFSDMAKTYRERLMEKT